MGNVTTIDLIRHGEIQGGDRFRGSTDDPLTSKGHQQMFAALGNSYAWDLILSSPLCRCADFACAYARYQDIPLIIDDRFEEMHFGDWEGKTVTAVLKEDKCALENFWRDPYSFTPPGGEHFSNFRERVLAAWDTHLDKHRGRNLLVITHGGVVRVILGHILSMEPHALLNIDIPPASVSRVRALSQETGYLTHHLVFHGGRP